MMSNIFQINLCRLTFTLCFTSWLVVRPLPIFSFLLSFPFLPLSIGRIAAFSAFISSVRLSSSHFFGYICTAIKTKSQSK